MAKAKIPMLIGAVFEVLGFVSFVAGVIADADILLYLGAGLFFVGGITLAISMYVEANPGSFPVKKVLVCAAFLIVGAILTGVLTSVISDAGGLDALGFAIILPTIPLVVSVAACIWYWQRNE